MSAGALGQLVASPTDLVKVQMQMDGKRVAVGKLPKYKSTFHCASVLFKEAGLRGMWRGTRTHVGSNLSQLASLESPCNAIAMQSLALFLSFLEGNFDESVQPYCLQIRSVLSSSHQHAIHWTSIILQPHRVGAFVPACGTRTTRRFDVVRLLQAERFACRVRRRTLHTRACQCGRWTCGSLLRHTRGCDQESGDEPRGRLDGPRGAVPVHP